MDTHLLPLNRDRTKRSFLSVIKKKMLRIIILDMESVNTKAQNQLSKECYVDAKTAFRCQCSSLMRVS